MALGLNHICLRVADIDRAAAFYRDALGGRIGTRPVPRSGPFVEEVLGGPGGVIQRGCHILLGATGSSGIELVEVGNPYVPVEHAPRWQRTVPHVGLTVGDVRSTVERIQAAGGRLLFPVREAAGRPFAYCEDLDGHVLELVEMSWAEAVQTVLDFVPGADPAADPPGAS
jgi:catechol 2,3-dioxygenase-like lactoylglutathione lyase family enzyme